MKKAKVMVHPSYKIGEIDRRLFGAFLEPIGDWVYGGIYNPTHPTADDLGFRKDMIELTKELGIPAVRLPGGNFMSGWEWKDSIGPKDQRKAHLDLAWRQFETNEVGHDEYLEWAKRVGTEAIYTLNLGTGSSQDALHCVEYTNVEGGTYWSDLRKKNGYEKPHKVKTWCLGNEMDGPWQIDSWERDPKGYGIKTREIAKIVKYIDPDCEVVVAGTSTPNNRTYPRWDLEVLNECYNKVDYLSLHYYHTAPEGDIGALMTASTVMDEFIENEIGACDLMKAHLHSDKTVMIAFDEYGVSFGKEKKKSTGRAGVIDDCTYNEFSEQLKRPFRYNDPKNPENNHHSNMLESLALSSVLMSLIRHADRVKVGCYTIGLFQIGHDWDHVWKEIGYYPYEQFIRYARGTSLRPAIDSPTYTSNAYNLDDFNQKPSYENVPYIEVCASHDEENGKAAIFVINRNWEEDMEVELDVSGFEGYHLVAHTEMQTDDLEAYNTYEDQKVVPVEITDTKIENGKINMKTKKLSFNVIRLEK